MLITDINTLGPSTFRIYSNSSLISVFLNGEFNGATVSIQKLIDGNWYTLKDYTANAYDGIETVGPGVYRFSTDGAPTIICDVELEYIWSGSGSIIDEST